LIVELVVERLCVEGDGSAKVAVSVSLNVAPETETPLKVATPLARVMVVVPLRDSGLPERLTEEVLLVVSTAPFNVNCNTGCVERAWPAGAMEGGSVVKFNA